MSGPQPVPIGEVKDYLDLICEDDPRRRRRYLKVLQQMDNIYIAHMREAAKQASSKGQ